MQFNSVQDCFKLADHLAQRAENEEDSLKLKEFSRMYSSSLTEYLGEFKILLRRLIDEGKLQNERGDIERLLNEIDACLGLRE